MLNKRLIEQQGLTEQEVAYIEQLHAQREEMFKEMEALDPAPTMDRTKLREYVGKLEQLEFEMQRGWKFEVNRDYHTWWYCAPHCECPKMDNRELQGTKYRITAGSCPLHGGGE